MTAAWRALGGTARLTARSPTSPSRGTTPTRWSMTVRGVRYFVKNVVDDWEKDKPARLELKLYLANGKTQRRYSIAQNAVYTWISRAEFLTT